MGFLYKDKEYVTDSEGFLQDESLWNDGLMHYMASLDNLILSKEHILVIKLVRKYYEEFATTPPIRSLITYLKQQGHSDIANSIALAKLFPLGAAKSAAKYAGLKKPVKCI